MGTEATSAASASAPARQPPAWRRAVPFVLAAALIAFVFSRIEWTAFGDQLSRVNYLAYFGFIIAFVFALLFADTFATVYIYRTIARVSFRDLFVVRAASYLPSLLNHHVGQAWLTYLLSRQYKIPLKRVVGATLLAYVTWGGCILCLAAISLVSAGLPVLWMAIPLVAGVAYLLLLWRKPDRLTKTFMAPLFEAGPWGHIRAMALRIPHLIVLFVGTWVPFAFFDVQIPLAAALTYIPVLMVVVALPLTPVGIGTRDVLAAQFFQDYVAGGTLAERNATLAASTTTVAVALTVVDAIIGLIALRWATELVPPRTETASGSGDRPDSE